MNSTWEINTRRRLNRNARPPERDLFTYLRDNRNFKKYGPVRQNWPVDWIANTFFLDVYFPELKFAIEIDSEAFHGSDAAKRADELRSVKLFTIGVSVLRVPASEIMSQFDAVVFKIKYTLERRSKQA